MTKQLYLMLGYPGSGKSTFARQLADRTGVVRISQDYLRKTTFTNPRDHMNTEDDHMLLQAMNKLAQENLRTGNSVIYDANVELIRDREAIYTFVSELGAKSYLLWIKTPLDISLHRNGPAKHDDQFVKDYTKMVVEYEKRLQIPLDSEPTIIIKGDTDFEQQYTQLVDNI